MSEAPPQESIATAEELRFYERRYLAPLLTGLALVKAATVLIYLSLMVPFRFDISFPEGAVVARAFEAACGGSVYTDWRVWPHQFAPYGPLTYYPVAWAAALTGRTTHPIDLYMLGRMQSFLAIVGILATIWAIVRRLGCGWVWGALAACGFLAWRPEMEFAVSFRPDAPAVFFSLLALALAVGAKPTIPRIAAVFAILSISFWYKASSFGMVVVLGYWVFRGQGWRRAMAALACFALAGVIPAIALDRVMEGRLFLNLVQGLNNGIEPWNWLYIFTTSPSVPLAIMIAALVISCARIIKSGVRNCSFVDAAPIVVFGFASVQLAKIGASYNYYTEFYALACIACGVAGAGLWNSARRFPRGIILWGIVTPLFLYDSYIGLSQTRFLIGTMLRAQGNRALFRRVEQIEGPIFVQTADLALLRPSPPTVLDYVHYSLMVRRGFIDGAGLLAKIKEHHFTAVIGLTNNLETARRGEPNDFLFTSPEFVRLLDQNYIETERIEPYSILRPRNP